MRPSQGGSTPSRRSGEVQLIRDGTAERLPAAPADRFGLSGSDHDAYRIEFDAFEQTVAGERPSPFGRDDASTGQWPWKRFSRRPQPVTRWPSDQRRADSVVDAPLDCPPELGSSTCPPK
jgi:hypothetical protein